MPTKIKNSLVKDNSKDNKIYVFDFDQDNFLEKEAKSIDECVELKNTPSISWVNIDRVPPVGFLDKLTLGFDLHPVIIDDIFNINQRPRVEILDDYIYLVFKMLTVNEAKRKIESEQVSLIVGEKFVITFQQGIEGDTFAKVREKIRNPKSRVRTGGTDYLGYVLIDSVVDGYFSILENFSDRLEKLEEQLINDPGSHTLKEIYALKREILHLRKAVWPLREAITVLERGESKLIKKTTRIYFRDVYDHLIQIVDTMETYREMLSGMVDIYLSSLNNRMNSVMKVLTVITTIFMPLTFIAGIYGMNFKHMPELEHVWGYPFVLGVMATVALIMLVYFQRKKWL
ncbi:MAG TPA: magnesium/cobalt transporter CorA [Patescibacteria group bacterium]|nr:magnesium/cobalt transporter CorA [Patescibacteria group bacterium]